ncbi:EAL domain-containing protein [Halanaerobium sp. Z-7514]|uniref:EAL domain-containing protein n=1 Tax=Halanaerobium polyolivorans TaxID=2886943 RepID=A0AAW4X030_9FIRM|nr:EAL domain-containing protein [Halanaerobium polyolivorans]MCC3144661.1 EAL domain-containing protein [Halanaerobium polyolivorans]
MSDYKELKYNKKRYNSIYHNAPLPFISWNAEGRIIDLNQKAEELFGWKFNEIKNKKFISTIIAEKDREEWKNWKKEEIESFPNYLFSQAIKKDGSRVDCSWYNNLITEKGKVKEVISIARHRKNYAKKEIDFSVLQKAINETDNWIVVTDSDGVIKYANTTVKEVTGYDKTEINKEDPSLFKSGKHDDEFYKNLWETIKSGEVFNDVIINKKKNGELFYSEQTITPIKNSQGEIVNFISVGKDITQNEKLKQKIEYISNYDLKFSLPNRKAIVSKINDLIKLDKLQKLAVIAININKIKHLNDLYSSDKNVNSLMNLAADLINIKADNRKNSVKIDKEHYLAYLGGDKFALIIDNLNSINKIHEIAEKILNLFAEPVNYNNNSLMLNASLGISIYPDDCRASESLLSNAEVALIKSKKNDYAFFDRKMNLEIKRYSQMEAQLNQAIKNDDFIIYYQPYYCGQNHSLYGLEALLRFNTKDNKSISPEEFIPILEESKLIKKVGLIVIKKVIANLKRWIELGYQVVPISINLSAKQLEDRKHLEKIYQIITESEINNSLIRFEITESSAMDDVDHNLEIMRTMKEKGFAIAIDDFGTGYSSFSYLHKFPIDFLKIDISFIRNMTLNKEGKGIVEAIINLAHVLKLKTIAEGVETEAELKQLNELNNDYVQGYYFSKAMPIKKIESYLKSFIK